MKRNIIHRAGVAIMVIQSDTLVITDVQSALDFIATTRYEVDCDRVAINKEAVAEDFFRLSTGLAGEVLQKFSTYRMKLAIIGDFSGYTSKPLQDFIGECNRGTAIFFVPDEEKAVERLEE